MSMTHDGRLQHNVLAELSWDPSIDAAHIGVAADNGVITLSGHVSSYAQKRAAEDAARRVRGVEAVAEEIEVRLPFEAKRADDQIAAAALQRLHWDTTVPPHSVQVTVDAGLVTLTGQVAWHYQREAAEDDVRSLTGVVAVTNDITIKPKVDCQNISDDIMHALHRSWFFDPKTISVSGDDGHIRLTGTVHTPHERKVAAATAWAAPGVTDVKNELRVI
jgi:osmotically-inducible protein OsmY